MTKTEVNAKEERRLILVYADHAPAAPADDIQCNVKASFGLIRLTFNLITFMNHYRAGIESGDGASPKCEKYGQSLGGSPEILAPSEISEAKRQTKKRAPFQVGFSHVESVFGERAIGRTFLYRSSS